MFSFHGHIPVLASIKNLTAGCVEPCPCLSWIDSRGGYHLYRGVICLAYVIFLHQAKQQKLSIETVITAAATHWYDKKANDLMNGHGIHFNYILSSGNAYQYYMTGIKSKRSEIN